MVMTKIFSLVLALALVTVISIAAADTASAKGKRGIPINVETYLAVAAIEGLETNLHSGWSTIEKESLVGLGLIDVIEGPAELNWRVLSAEQSSHEQFTAFDLSQANVTKGKSKGTFYMTSVIGGAPIVGSYDLKVSSINGCQIYGEGKWKSKAKNSLIDGKGKITVCTNWDPNFLPQPTFVTFVTITGQVAVVD
jgi:hypothetical protein